MSRCTGHSIVLACIVWSGLLAAPVAFAQERPDALEMYRQGNYEGAVAVCLEEIREMPRNMNSYVVLCWSLIRLGRYQESLEWATRAMAISRYDPRIIQIMGETLYNLGRYLDALKYLEEYVVVSPGGALIEHVFFHMGEIFIRFGEYHNADIALSTAVYHDPNRAFWWARLGYAREQAGDHRSALDAYTRSLQLNPGLGDAVRGRQRVQSQLGGGSPPAAAATTGG